MKKQNKLIYISVSSLVLFILTSILMQLGYFHGIDNLINSGMPSIQNPIIYNFSMVIHYLLDPITATIISLIIAILLWFKDSKRDSVVFASIALAGAFLIGILKLIFHTARPINPIETGPSFSFPSGHTAFAVILFGFFIYLAKKYYKHIVRDEFYFLLVFFMLLIGFSRIYIQVHWFSDVLGGFFLGLFVISTGFFINRLIKKK